MNATQVRAEIRKACERAGSARKWAVELGFSNSYLSEVLSGGREPGPLILDALGLEKQVVVTYRKKSNGAKR